MRQTASCGIYRSRARHVAAVRRLLAFMLFTERRVVLPQIPWAEPEDITPGFEERLAALCAARGRVLTGVYVRAGACGQSRRCMLARHSSVETWTGAQLLCRRQCRSDRAAFCPLGCKCRMHRAYHAPC